MNSRGFTLTEILVVMSIIGILVSIVTRNNAVVMERARDAALMSEVRHIRNAIHQFALDNGGSFPGDLTGLKPFLGKVATDWAGSRAKGMYSYEPVSGRLTLSRSRDDNYPDPRLDSKGRPYGEY